MLFSLGLVYGTEGAVGAFGGLDGVDEGGDAPTFGGFYEVDLVDAAMGSLAVAMEIVGGPEAGEAATDAELGRPHALDQLVFGSADAGGKIGCRGGGGFAGFADGDQACVFEEEGLNAGAIVGSHEIKSLLHDCDYVVLIGGE